MIPTRTIRKLLIFFTALLPPTALKKKGESQLKLLTDKIAVKTAAENTHFFFLFQTNHVFNKIAHCCQIVFGITFIS